jgi:branched-chain amino acid transport system permease protein
MQLLLTHGLINGIIIGGVYALVGLSLNILYGVLRVLNFAHGQFIIAGSFLAYVLFNALGIAPYYAVPIAAVSFFIAGWLAYYLLIPRLALSEDPETASFLLMYGVSIALTAILVLLFEADSRSIDFTFTPISIQIGPIYVATSRIVAFGIAVVLSLALTAFLFLTLPGKALRAMSMNREAIKIVGVDIGKLAALAFALATSIAGLSGVLVAMVFPAFNPFSGDYYSILGFIIIVLGGLGNPLGAMAAGVAYGLIDALSSVFFQQAYAQIVGFLLLIGVIVWRAHRNQARIV